MVSKGCRVGSTSEKESRWVGLGRDPELGSQGHSQGFCCSLGPRGFFPTHFLVLLSHWQVTRPRPNAAGSKASDCSLTSSQVRVVGGGLHLLPQGTKMGSMAPGVLATTFRISSSETQKRSLWKTFLQRNRGCSPQSICGEMLAWGPLCPSPSRPSGHLVPGHPTRDHRTRAPSTLRPSESQPGPPPP